MNQQGPHQGQRILWASWIGTALFVVSAAIATANDGFGSAHRAISLFLFGLGCLAFIAAFLGGVERSRTEEIAVSNLFFLAGSAPKAVRLHLFGSLAVQVVVGLVSASLRPYTLLAFGILVPMYGLGLAGIWGAEHGVFGDRVQPSPSQKPPAPSTQAEPANETAQTTDVPGEQRS